MPALGPSYAEYPMSQLKMYTSGLASSFHGMMRIPTIPVITPPVLKEIHRGATCETSLAGLTTFAAITSLCASRTF